MIAIMVRLAAPVDGVFSSKSDLTAHPALGVAVGGPGLDDVFPSASVTGNDHLPTHGHALPAFARQKAHQESALRGYKELNLRALKILNPGGYLVTCSCSFHVSEADLLELVASASLDAHRTVVVVERRTQSRDHPILLTVPETHYLKCLILRVL